MTYDDDTDTDLLWLAIIIFTMGGVPLAMGAWATWLG